MNEEKKISRSLLVGGVIFLAIVLSILFGLLVGSGKKERTEQVGLAEEQKIKAFKEDTTEDPAEMQKRLLKQQEEKEKEMKRQAELLLQDFSPPSRADLDRLEPPSGVNREDFGDAGFQPNLAAKAMVLPQIYENYKSVTNAPTHTPKQEEDALSDREAQELGLKDESASNGETRKLGTYPTNKPRAPDSYRLLRQGAIIDAVLVNGINTQLPGTIQLRTVADVYDSVGNRKLLIPKGSVMYGSFGAPISQAGLDRIPISINRIMFSDGRAIDISGSPVADSQGYMGAPARFHSNLLRALGPSTLVAWIGYKIDQSQMKDRSSQPTTGVGSGTVNQPPNVSQQIIPKIEERIASRYESAMPYYTIEPGTRIYMVLAEDIVIPEALR